MNKHSFPTVTLQKIITSSLFTVLLLIAAANIYEVLAVSNSIHSPLQFVYQYRYALLILGGYGIGNLIMLQSKNKETYETMYVSLFFGLFSISLYYALELVEAFMSSRGLLQTIHGVNATESLPIVVLLIVLVIALPRLRNSRSIKLSRLPKVLFVLSFLMFQGFYLLSDIHIASRNVFTTSDLVAYFLNPLFILVVSLVVLSKLPNHLRRLFYATIIAMIYYLLTISLIEFKITTYLQPGYSIFSIVSVVSLLYIAVLLIRAFRATKSLDTTTHKTTA